MHSVVAQSQGCESSGRSPPVLFEPPGTASGSDTEAVAAADVGEAGDAAARVEDSARSAASSRVRRATSLRSAASASAGVVARLPSNSSCSCLTRTIAGSRVVRYVVLTQPVL